MKKKYLQPLAVVTEIETMSMTCTSNGVTSPDKGIGYGGVDEEGEKDPSSRRRRDVWDDEEEEEEW